MDIGYLIGVLILPIAIVIVAIVMRLTSRNRPLKPKHYLIVGIVYALLIGINALMPMSEKITIVLLAAIILFAGYCVDKKLSKTQVE